MSYIRVVIKNNTIAIENDGQGIPIKVFFVLFFIIYLEGKAHMSRFVGLTNIQTYIHTIDP